MIESFTPILAAASGIDLSDPTAAEALLEARLAPGGEAAQALEAELLRLLAEGHIANRGEEPVRWGRVCGASDETGGHSIDVVHMSAPGPRHRHPLGEIDYCIATEGEPTFDGRPPGWVVFAPDSTHTPTVAGGKMLIVYLLPDGAIEFERS